MPGRTRTDVRLLGLQQREFERQDYRSGPLMDLSGRTRHIGLLLARGTRARRTTGRTGVGGSASEAR